MKKQKYLEIRNELNLNLRNGPLVYFFLVEISLFGLASALWIGDAHFFVFPILAVIMFRNFSLMHDAVHGAVSKNRKLNNFIGNWSGCLCLLPFQGWKESHLKHHLWSGNIDKDPVMGLRTSLPRASAWSQKVLTFTWRAWIPALAALQNLLFWNLAFEYTVKSRSFKAWGRMLFPFLIWTAFFFLAPAGFFLRAFLPALVLYLIAVEVVNFPHHLQLPMSTGDTRDPVWEQYKTSRTCLYPKWFARHVVLNFNYHAEHHMFPDAPWYTLEAVHKVLREELRDQLNVDVHLGWIIDNRPLTLLEVVSPTELKREKAAS